MTAFAGLQERVEIRHGLQVSGRVADAAHLEADERVEGEERVGRGRIEIRQKDR